MRMQIHTSYFGRLALACFMLLWCCAFYGCDNSSDSGRDDQVRVHETVGSPPVIESIKFRRYINGEYFEVFPQLYPTDGYIYHFSQDEYISFEITATDPDLDMREVTITTYDVFDMETGDPLEYYHPPELGPDVHEIPWCESFDISICHQPEENVTFYLKNALRLNTGWLGPKQIWLTIQDLGNNSSDHYILYARN
ncbi:MAG: hypothetical protein JRI91_09190 [Deltaproteobacteria bacterium]|nr:hypothetical protein [Deltaproteobacteria bacterium]